MTTEEDYASSKRRCISSIMSLKSAMWDSTNKPLMSIKKSSNDVGVGRQSVPYCAKVHESITMEMDEVFISTKRRQISCMMSPTSSM